MWASKIGYCAAASRGPPRTSRAAASETSGPRAVIAGILSRGPSRDAGRPARPTRAVADALRIGDRGEDHAVRLGDTSLVRAAEPADDPRRGAADERRRRALEREQARLHLAAERIVSPRPVAPDHPVARDDHRHGGRAERVADGGRDGVREEVPQCCIHSVHPFGSSSAFRRIALPRLSWLFTVLMEIPRTLASSRYERPFT